MREMDSEGQTDGVRAATGPPRTLKVLPRRHYCWNASAPGTRGAETKARGKRGEVCIGCTRAIIGIEGDIAKLGTRVRRVPHLIYKFGITMVGSRSIGYNATELNQPRGTNQIINKPAWAKRRGTRRDRGVFQIHTVTRPVSANNLRCLDERFIHSRSRRSH